MSKVQDALREDARRLKVSKASKNAELAKTKGLKDDFSSST